MERILNKFCLAYGYLMTLFVVFGFFMGHEWDGVAVHSVFLLVVLMAVVGETFNALQARGERARKNALYRGRDDRPDAPPPSV